MSIVLVGNAPIENKIGYLIDDCDMVVRIGTCDLKMEFSENIGVRADRWALTPWMYKIIMNNSDLQVSIHNILSQVNLIQFIWWEFMYKAQDRIDYYKEFLTKVKVPVEALHKRSVEPEIQKDVDDVSINRGPPTTGMNVMSYYISAFKDQDIYFAGFGPRDHSVRRAHRDSKDLVWPDNDWSRGNGHNLDMCRELLNLWEDKEYVIRLG